MSSKVSFNPSFVLPALLFIGCTADAPNAGGIDAMAGDAAGDAAPIYRVPAPTAVMAQAVPVTTTATVVTGDIFTFARGSAVDSAGNYYAVDSLGVKRVTPAGTATTILDSIALGFGVTVDSDKNVYVGTTGPLRKITPTGVITNLTEPIGRLIGLDTDSAGTMYGADLTNRRVVKITREGVVSTLVTLGSEPQMRTYDLAVDRAGTTVYIARADDNRIYKITGSPPAVTVFAGSGVAGNADGVGAAATLSYPTGLATDSTGNVYVADNHNGRLRRITPNGTVTTLLQRTGTVWDVAVDSLDNVYYGQSARALRKLDPVGIGELTVSWQAPTSDSPITGYTATAMAPGQPSQRCSSSGEPTCTLHRLVSGVAYDIRVSATSPAGAGAPSAPVSATAN